MMKSNLVRLSSGLLLAALFAMAQSEREYSQSAVEATATTATTVEVAPEMELAPDDCGILPEPIVIDPLIPQAVGAWPFWISLPNGSNGSTRGILFVPDEHNFTDPDLPGWWVTKAGWFISAAYSGEVRLRGFNVADHSPIYFEFGDSGLIDLAVLNPEQPGGFGLEGLNHYAFFPSHIWVSKAGCYRLEAEWEGGLWQQVIAVGNLEG